MEVEFSHLIANFVDFFSLKIFLLKNFQVLFWLAINLVGLVYFLSCGGLGLQQGIKNKQANKQTQTNLPENQEFDQFYIMFLETVNEPMTYYIIVPSENPDHLWTCQYLAKAPRCVTLLQLHSYTHCRTTYI